MKSFYELTMKDVLKLEQGKRAHRIWVTNNVMGISLSSISSVFITLQIILKKSFNFSYAIFLLFLILGLFIVYSAALEYHKKLNSWLRVSKKIVRD